MRMKHPRDDERVETSLALLGSDHSKKKRQRTLSVGSESSSTENRSCNSNSIGNPSKKFTKSAMPVPESSSLSPRMIALLSSLEALEDSQQRQIKQQWPLGSTKASAPTPPTIPVNSSASTNQVVSTLLKQKQNRLTVGQPLTARPAIHKIEEHPPVQVSTSTRAPVESREMSNHSPSVEKAAINTIKRAVAAASASATVGASFEHNASGYTGLNAALAQHRIAGAGALASVVPKSGASFLHGHPIIVGAKGAPLAAFSFPTLPGATTSSVTSAKYGISHLNHNNGLASALRPSARQVAIHTAVHNDYKKIYKPLKRPPRLPTPHEALVIAAISTAAPTASVCR
eukprot:CAMPEP_0116124436 /NCGR_PEP_ID=MMETSP0329-20121206/5279_1 /TAXON_ID=697910 /ORGANISM="Pseudo-nitzschia arenysensis, Strain B593" /LENGTH=343 /DNA_ID=CAMNT_0003618415 /DNA_START=232 /DNA_END=1263 /DNA_ORIENTATION=+